MMKKLLDILMLSCKQATALIDLKFARKLSLKEKVKLRLHTSICEGCKAYIKQSKVLDELLHKHIHTTVENVPIIENKELKQQIISKL